MTKNIRPIRIEGNVAFVPLTRGLEAIIDVDDIHLIDRFNWHARPGTRTHYAARTRRPEKPRVRNMQNQIMQPDAGFIVDHIDGNGLNNRRCNLRFATIGENNRNIRMTAANTSGRKGVDWHKRCKRWRAQIKFEGKKIHLGYYSNVEDAHAAYCAASERLHGEFGRPE